MGTTVCADSDDFDTLGTKLQIKKGCGLKGSTDGVAADVADWPYTCPQDANATEIYCSPTTGQLQGPPVPKMFLAEDASAELTDTIGPGGQRDVVATITADTSTWCGPGTVAMAVTPEAQWDVDANNNGDNFKISFLASVDGAAFTPYVVVLDNEPVSATEPPTAHWSGTGTAAALHKTFPIGAAHSIAFRVRIENTGPTDIVGKIQVRVRGLIFQQQL